jgi:hypothetical protein
MNSLNKTRILINRSSFNIKGVISTRVALSEKYSPLSAGRVGEERFIIVAKIVLLYISALDFLIFSLVCSHKEMLNAKRCTF